MRQLVADMAETMEAAERRRAGRDPGRGAGAPVHRRRPVAGRRRGLAAQGVHQPGDRRAFRTRPDRRRGLPVVPRESTCRSSAACGRACARSTSTGSRSRSEGEALFARAIQHETDHLNGRLLIDQVGPVKREIIKRKLRKDARPSARSAEAGRQGRRRERGLHADHLARRASGSRAATAPPPSNAAPRASSRSTSSSTST